jgi:nucleotide-binding universal stress UspA family protein
MTPTIIIEFEDSERGRDALALGRSLGATTGARLMTVTSYDRDPYGMLPAVGGWYSTIRQRARAAAEVAENLLGDAPGAVSRVVGAASPAQALHETAEREQAGLIVVGADPDNQPGRVAAGAIGRQVLQGAPCSVALAPAGFARSGNGLAPVGAGFDGSWESRLALTAAAGLADALAGELRVISVLKRPPAAHPMFAFTSYHRYLEELEADRRSNVIDAIDALHVHPDVDPVVVDGEPADVLADLSRELGLLVMGSRGYGPLRQVFLGSVSDALLECAACPVMIVPRGVDHGYGSPILHARAARSH